MKYAFDSWLETIVSAENAARNSDNERFRYKCLCCDEEVFIAAEESSLKATHFRHRSGNNDQECELYLGSRGIDTSSSGPRSKPERIDFYYDNQKKCFSVSLAFTDEEIAQYETDGSVLEICENKKSHPFQTQRIDRQFFVGGKPESIILERYASPYYISVTSSFKSREYDVLSYDHPSFFKILNYDLGNDNFIARFIKSRYLYSSVAYFLAWVGSNKAQNVLKTFNEVRVEKEVEFDIGRNRVWGQVVVFQSITPSLRALLDSWGFCLDSSENILLLWPPVYEDEDGKKVASSSEIYVHSSFQIGQGNINNPRAPIVEIPPSLTKIDLSKPLHIIKKNAELEIRKEQLSVEIKKNAVVKEYLNSFKAFKVPKGNSYFLFSDYGVEKLSEGQSVFLTANSFVAEYSCNSLSRIIALEKPSKLDLEKRFHKILSNYWATKEYSAFESASLPQVIQDYLDNCKRTGRINIAVERLIKGER